MKALHTPLQVFCSFAPEDAEMCTKLHNHLRLLEREELLTLWHQRLITAGTDWATTIDEQLASASIILLLISPAFIASDYCYGVEMQKAVQQHKTGHARVIPIIVRSVDWMIAPFAHLSPLPITGKPLAEQRHPDAAFAAVVADLRRVIEELAPTSMNRFHIDAISGVWNVPHRRNPHFTGRDDLLNQLDQQLSGIGQDTSAITRRAALTQPQAIKGLGGIGKTQIAVEYAYRAREQERYIHIFWINAASEEAILASFVALAELLPAFSAQKEADQRELVAAIQRWLEQCQQRWLLIFDNADHVSLVQEYLPKTGNGSVLLTTRASAVGSLASSIEVETMSFIEGTHLLLHRVQHLAHVSDETINEAGNIVLALDHFPLALDQAGAYIDETKCSFADYLSLYQSHRKELLARRGEQIMGYPDSVATTWALSFQKVELVNPAAAELLRLCASLSPDRIPEELLRDGAVYWTTHLQQAATNPFAFDQMLEELLKFSLVKRLAEEHMLSIHRLVQAVALDMMEREEQRQWAERIVRAVNEIFPRNPKEIGVWSQCLRYLEQAQACGMLIEQYSFVLSEAADLLERAATYLREHASYTLAEPLYMRALSIREQHTASSLNNLAILYYTQGKYTEAEPLFKRALSIRERQLGQDYRGIANLSHDGANIDKEQGNDIEHADIATSLNYLGALYWMQGKYMEAEPLFLRALSIRERVLGDQHPDTANSLNNLAVFYEGQGKYAEAEPLYQHALTIREQMLGPEHPHMAQSLDNLANLYQAQGKYTEAEPLFLRALAIRESVLGSDHPETAVSLNNLSNLYSIQGKYVEAEPLHQRALSIREQVQGADHPDTAVSLNNLADLYRIQGRYVEAEPLYQRALAIYERTLGNEHLYTAVGLNNLADLYLAQGRYAEAMPLYQHALAIREQVQGADHPETQTVQASYADLLKRMQADE